MTTNTNPDPAPSLAQLLLDYFAAATDNQLDDAFADIAAYLDAAPPSSTADLDLMLRACIAEPDLARRINEYLDARN